MVCYAGDAVEGPAVMKQPYSDRFYRKYQAGSRRSAEETIPILLNSYRPESVVDVGCGVGTWAAEFSLHGVRDIVGIDGDYVDRTLLHIPSERFVAKDLKQPLVMDRTFDLVVSLEVAEHLPSSCAQTFVQSLTSLGSVVLFSAAIPFQGGTQHLNEQWQDYWAILFKEHGFVPIDCIRPAIWNNPNVDLIYAQNTILYVRSDVLEGQPQLAALRKRMPAGPLSVVHPRLYLMRWEESQPEGWYAGTVLRYLIRLPLLLPVASLRTARRWLTSRPVRDRLVEHGA